MLSSVLFFWFHHYNDLGQGTDMRLQEEEADR